MARTKKEVTVLRDSEGNDFATLTKTGWNWNYKKLNKLNINLTIRDYVKLFSKAGCYIPELGRTLTAEIPEKVQRQQRKKSKAEIRADIKSIYDLDSLGSVTFVLEKDDLVAKNADGGHRSRCVCGVVSNEIGYEYDKNTTIYFEDLTEEHQEKILDSTINVEIISGEDADLFDIFIRRNSGKTVNTMEKLHAEFGEDETWKLADRLGEVSYIDELFKTNGSNHNDGYRKTGTILQVLGMMYKMSIAEEPGVRYATSKTTARRLFLKEGQSISASQLKKLEKEAMEIFLAMKDGTLVINAFYSAKHKGRKAHNMNGSNLAIVIKRIIEDGTPTEKGKFLKEIASPDFAPLLKEALKVNESDLSKRPYFIACKDGKDVTNQLTELENALKEALSM